VERAAPIVREAVEGGITFFDTADMYSDGKSERITGALLRRMFASREEYVLATKVFFPTGAGPNDRGLSRKHLMAAIDASLQPRQPRGGAGDDPAVPRPGSRLTAV